jgi:hypothetical protein
MTLQTPFYGHDAEVYLGFVRGDKVGFIEVSFTSSKQSITGKDRLKLFQDLRKRLEQLSGKQYSYARIDGIDVLGESGGWVPDRRKNSAFVFGVTTDGIGYQLEIFGESVGALLSTGDVRLTIDSAESVEPPSDVNVPAVGTVPR